MLPGNSDKQNKICFCTNEMTVRPHHTNCFFRSAEQETLRFSRTLRRTPAGTYMVFPVGESGFGLYTGFGIGLNFQPAVSYSINDEKKPEFVIMFFYDPCIATCVAGS